MVIDVNEVDREKDFVEDDENENIDTMIFENGIVGNYILIYFDNPFPTLFFNNTKFIFS